MSPARQTHVAILTPAGRGAVASIAALGPSANATVEHFFHPAGGRALTNVPAGRIVFGRWGSPAGEEIVACRRGEEDLELHCHGGRAAAEAIIHDLVGAGCEKIHWSDWARLQIDDPIVAEARCALAEARTEKTAAILLDQYHGALSRAIQEIRSEIVTGHVDHSLARLDELLRWKRLGCHLVEPWRVVLAGLPNVGKSSLINAIVGFRRAIVYDKPGTTRDVITATTAIDGWAVELADTAGLREGGDPIEAAGIRQAKAMVRAADGLVLVFDSSQPWTPQDQALVDAWPHGICVHNKCDLIKQSPLDRPPGHYLSATAGIGLDELIQMIGARLVFEPPPAGAAIPFKAEQFDALEQTQADLQAGRVPFAIQRLDAMRAFVADE